MGNRQRISRSRPRRRVRLAGFALPLICACAARQESLSSTSTPSPEFELLSDEPAVAGRPLAPAAHDDLLLEDDFERLDPRWSDRSPGGAIARSVQSVEVVAEAPGARGVAVLSPGAGGIHARIAVAPADALLVTARVRSFAVGRDAMLLANNVTDERSEPRFVPRSVAASDSFTDWSVVVDSCRERKFVQIGLVAGDRPLAIDRIEVRRLTPAEGIWLAQRTEESPPLPRGRHRVELAAMDLEMEGCYVPAGATLRWRARVPVRAPRLDLETCLVGGDRGGALEWIVVVDGVPLARRREQLSADERENAFIPWIVPLDRFAGREVVVELRCVGDREVLGFAGAPRVLGEAGAAAPPNVILVSLDTLRPDRVGRRVGGRSLTPNVDRLVAKGTLFTDACSTSSWTLPAQTSLLTGQHPLVHQAIDSDRRIDDRRSPMLAERFRRMRYATAAFTAGNFVDPRFGFGSGFDLYSVRDPCGVPHDLPLPHSPFDPLVAADAEIDATPEHAFAWVRRHADVPFFLFLHTYHVHEYDDDAHDGVNSRRKELLDRADGGDSAAVAELTRRYDECVAETDHDLVGGLLDLLEQLHLDERTLVAIVSDHGEEFLEHGGFRHGLTLRDEVGSVAMVLAGPGVPRGAQIDRPVSVTGVAPTLARLAGLPPDPRCFGRDLLVRDDDEPPAILLHLDHYCTGHVHVRGEALWIGDWQMQRMWNEQGEATLSFERRDPATGLFSAAEPSPEERRALERRLDAEIADRLRKLPPVAETGEHELPEALRERLEALGYTGR
jgi:arylsulfatase A-like enzyme